MSVGGPLGGVVDVAEAPQAIFGKADDRGVAPTCFDPNVELIVEIGAP
jgi:hypothetical protein